MRPGFVTPPRDLVLTPQGPALVRSRGTMREKADFTTDDMILAKVKK